MSIHRHDCWKIFDPKVPHGFWNSEVEKVNPEHSHPFDVRAMVIQGALTLTRDGTTRTYKSGETFSMPKGCLHYESYGPEGAVTLFGRKM